METGTQMVVDVGDGVAVLRMCLPPHDAPVWIKSIRHKKYKFIENERKWSGSNPVWRKDEDGIGFLDSNLYIAGANTKHILTIVY